MAKYRITQDSFGIYFVEKENVLRDGYGYSQSYWSDVTPEYSGFVTFRSAEEWVVYLQKKDIPKKEIKVYE